MGDLMNFSFRSQAVRTVLVDGEPWFVAKDVCNILGLEQVSRAMSRLDEDERGLVKVTHPQNPSKLIGVNAVSEPGLYQLVLASYKPEAKAFKRWITREVLPSIRKTGQYGASIDVNRLSPEMQMFHHMFESVAKTQLQLEEVRDAVNTIQDTFLQRDKNWRGQMNSLIAGAAYRSEQDYGDVRSLSYQKLEERAHCDLSRRLDNLHQRLAAAGATKTQINDTNRMDVIEQDPRLKEIYSSICKELSIGSMKVMSH